jgi:hypothetical protein
MNERETLGNSLKQPDVASGEVNELRQVIKEINEALQEVHRYLGDLEQC